MIPRKLFPSDNLSHLLWRTIKSLSLLLLVAYFAFLSFSAFSSDHSRSRFPDSIRRSFDLPFPFSPSSTNLSHILFSVAGSVNSWPDRRHYIEHWFSPGRTRAFVWLDEQPPPDHPWPATSPPYRVSENTSRFGPRSAARIARIVLEAYRLGSDGIRWFVMGDDDTVFFPENLVSVLNRYDPDEMYYVGGVSESVEQDVIHSYGMAFGGGGFAVSRPLAAALSTVLDGCLDRYASLYGSDQRVQACLAELGVPLSRDLGFHQMDIRGDAFGLLAAHPVTPLVSLHHLVAVGPIDPRRETQIDSLRTLDSAYRVDPGRTLQQTFCYEPGRNWSVSVSWGYTVQIYPWVVSPRDLEIPAQTFRTWRSWADGPFTFNTRPWPDHPCKRPLVYLLDRVEESGWSGTMSYYSRFKREPECELVGFGLARKVQKVRVVSPKMDPNEWTKAPRRYCCEVRTEDKKTLEVSIQRCGSGESASPP
ncbi:hypothetical protein QJS04_geneDACA007739 [Acorus gramineus]|uniref:Uncharacterized protein n=1 Tax=Acorus gramineus TaxID=55184 RepID=A0AAV9B3I5_ACOGR|nr:hypothetical protein QJS04_geneDACA007739 [Acorus gramineus]